MREKVPQATQRFSNSNSYKGHISSLLYACLFLLLLTACNNEHREKHKPHSIGELYEVLLISDDKKTGDVMYEALNEAVAGLPQVENYFDVKRITTNQVNKHTQYSRSIISINVDSSKYKKAELTYIKNTYAYPQTIISINTPSAESLQKEVGKFMKKIKQLIITQDNSTQVQILTDNNNTKAKEDIETMLKCFILIPPTLKYEKKGENFIWLSDKNPQCMKNICVYTYNGLDLTMDKVIEMRDSIMKENIPGQSEGMYMTTAPNTSSVSRTVYNNKSILVVKGLWEMENDAMGGPFITHSIVDSANNRVITAEAFIYGPGEKKRDRMRRLEAALYTLNKLKDNKPANK